MITIKHVDDLFKYPEYMEKKKQLLLKSYSVSESECWNWTKGTNDRGRATIKVGRHMHYVSRIAYVIFHKEKVNSLYVLHTCDNPACINPKHLWLGTQTDNMRDMISKDRDCDTSGESNPFAKLTEKDIRGIRLMVASGNSLANTGKVYGIAYQHVARIVKREAWGHVK